eukprot:scaffold150030_cov27-Prasinocladus_malaysianus.AAC.1
MIDANDFLRNILPLAALSVHRLPAFITCTAINSHYATVLPHQRRCMCSMAGVCNIEFGADDVASCGMDSSQ